MHVIMVKVGLNVKGIVIQTQHLKRKQKPFKNVDTLAIYCDWMVDALAMFDENVEVEI